jgi:GntR family transcriptional repressor for pyruvate dehydrogenase complex
MTFFNEIQKSTVSEQIIEQMRELILQGRLKPGERLPSERDLAEQLSVGRSSVREATRAMVALGIVEIRPGEGAFIRADFPRSTVQSIEWSSLMLNGHSDDLVEARIAVERCTARLAAARATPTDRERLRSLAEKMTKCDELDAFIALDIAFHLTMADASQNIVLREIIYGIQQLMRSTMSRVLRSDELRRISAQHHLQLCDAINRGDGVEAEQLLTIHLMKDRITLQSVSSTA